MSESAKKRPKRTQQREQLEEPATLTLPPGKFLKRSDVARRFGVSTSSIRRMEGSSLQPIVGPKGVRYFAEEQIEAVFVRIRRTSRAEIVDTSGPVAGCVFERLKAGMDAADIVKELRLEPELVEKLLKQWQRLSEAVMLTNADAQQIRRALGGYTVTDEASLLGAIAEHKRESANYCERCHDHTAAYCLECARLVGRSALAEANANRLF